MVTQSNVHRYTIKLLNSSEAPPLGDLSPAGKTVRDGALVSCRNLRKGHVMGSEVLHRQDSVWYNGR